VASIPVASLPPHGAPSSSAAGVEDQPFTQQLSPHQLWSIFRRHIGLVAGIVLTCVAVVLVVQLSQEDLYEATATVGVELNDSTGANQADAARNLQRVANEARIYRSSALAERVVKDLALNSNPAFTGGESMSVERATRILGRRTRVISTNDSDFIDIAVRSTSPLLAQRIANQYVDSLRELRGTRRQDRRDKLLRDISVERDRLAAELGEAEKAVADFRRDHRMLIGAGSAEDYQTINNLAAEAASAAALNAAGAARAAGVSSAVQARTSADATSPVLQQLEREKADLARQRSDLAVSLGSNHPKMKRLDAQIEQVDRNLSDVRFSVVSASMARNSADATREQRLAASEAGAASARAGVLQAQLGAITEKAFSSNRNNVDLAVLDRKAEVAREAYLTTAQRAQTIRAELDTTGVASSMVSAATVPDTPVAPAPVKAALATFVGSLMLAMLLVLVIEMFDNRIRNAEQLQKLFALRTLAMLPKLDKALPTELNDNPVLADPGSLYSEVARALLGEVNDLAVRPGQQTVLVTSPMPGDGKTSVSLALAAAASASGRRAIIVDLDLRRPDTGALRAMQQASPHPGLIEYLTGTAEMPDLLPAPERWEATDDNAVTPVHTPVVLSTDRPVPDPAAIIRGQQLGNLLTQLRSRFDLIIINAPAVLTVHDARLLTRAADCSLIVVRWGKTTIDQMKNAMEKLQTGVSAAVINQVDYREHARRRYGGWVDHYMGAERHYTGAANDGWVATVKEHLHKMRRAASI
jgi:Uncharacterized protein involved in exopolysaccharide biosynthesis